jgi:surface carbohydrate biosynthesis protein
MKKKIPVSEKLNFFLVQARKYFNYLKNIRFIYPQENSLLIYDVVGSEEMKRILFPDMEVTVLSVRGEWFSIHPLLISKILYYYFIKRLGLRLSYDLAFISSAKPKLLMTLIDNNHTFHKLAQLYDAPFICIQNGFRSHRCAESFEKMPILFCFGQRDIDLYKEHNVQMNHVFPVGSFRSSYFLSHIAPSLDDEPVHDICLISEYLPGMENNEYRFSEQGVRLLYEWLFVSCDYLKRYLAEKKLRVVIAGRQGAEENIGEVEFFRQCFGESIKVYPSNMHYLNSYRLAYKSSLVLSYFSSLGLEALTWGKKVLFYPHPSETNLIVDNSISKFFKTETDGYEEFENKMNYLLGATEENYQQETRQDMVYLMSEHLDTHKVIKNYINTILRN